MSAPPRSARRRRVAVAATWVALALLTAATGCRDESGRRPGAAGTSTSTSTSTSVSEEPGASDGSEAGDGKGDGDQFDAFDPGGIPAAYADAEWYPEYLRRAEYGARWLGAFRSFGTRRLQDGTNGFQSVRNGVRVSWTPPDCGDCRRLRVWMYGSSSLFGVGQRDDFTIPSQIAKLATEDGIAVDVVNRGLSGDQHWQEAQRLLWDLSRFEAPDLVVFYDGVSDVNAALLLSESGRGDVPVPVEPLTEAFLEQDGVQEAIDRSLRGDETEPPPVPPGIELATTTTIPPLDADGVGRLATTRYARSLRMSQDIATARNLPMAWYWQPSRYSRPPIEGEPATPEDPFRREVDRAAVASLPPGVVDLSSVLASDPRPFYADEVRHNEASARIIAVEMYRTLRPQLERLLGAGPG